jgi:hypothetical protein
MTDGLFSCIRMIFYRGIKNVFKWASSKWGKGLLVRSLTCTAAAGSFSFNRSTMALANLMLLDASPLGLEMMFYIRDMVKILNGK